MRVTFKVEGGIAFFPGLAKPIMIDTATLPAPQTATLENFIRAARFFELPSITSAPGADRRRFIITVEDGVRSHTATVTEPIQDPDLQALVEFLQARARAQRGAKPGDAD